MSELLTIVGGIIIVAAALGVAWSVLAANKNRNDIASLQGSNDELRATVAFQRGEREREQHDCKDEIAALRQQVEILQSEVVRGLVREFSTALREASQEVLGRSEPTPPVIVAVKDRRDPPE
jgi:hypothetical protein